MSHLASEFCYQPKVRFLNEMYRALRNIYQFGREILAQTCQTDIPPKNRGDCWLCLNYSRSYDNKDNLFTHIYFSTNVRTPEPRPSTNHGTDLGYHFYLCLFDQFMMYTIYTLLKR
jgi:hypothetical protein